MVILALFCEGIYFTGGDDDDMYKGMHTEISTLSSHLPTSRFLHMWELQLSVWGEVSKLVLACMELHALRLLVIVA